MVGVDLSMAHSLQIKLAEVNLEDRPPSNQDTDSLLWLCTYRA